VQMLLTMAEKVQSFVAGNTSLLLMKALSWINAPIALLRVILKCLHQESLRPRMTRCYLAE